MICLRPLPVLYACQGCAAHGQAARDVAALIEQPKARFPLMALDGCADGCARRWLAQRGITPDRHYILDSADVRRGFAAIAAELA